MHGEPVTDEERGEADDAAEQQQTIGDDLGNRAAQRKAQREQPDADDDEQDDKRVFQYVVAERPALGE